MKKSLLIEPNGWPCELQSCPAGLFLFGETLGFKSEYNLEPPYVVESGEVFWGGTNNDMDRALLIVQPCRAVWKVRA